MRFEDATEIVGAFGLLSSHLNDPKRWLPSHARTVPFSLPLDGLPCSKERIQTALAISIAGLVMEVELGPSIRMINHMLRAPDRDDPRLSGMDVRERLKYILHTASFLSGDLAWFTREPVFRSSNCAKPKGVLNYFASEPAYAKWQQTCESCLKELHLNSEMPESILPPALIEYWSVIDNLVPGLISNPVLVAIRET